MENVHDEECTISDVSPCTCEPAPALGRMPWTACHVTYIVRSIERAPDLSISKLPRGWELFCATPMGKSTAWFRLEFEITGPLNIADGETVKALIEELGMM